MSLRDSIAGHVARAPALPAPRRPAPAKVDWTELAPLVGQIADAISTHASLSTGAIEANPLLGKRPKIGVLYAVKAAGGVAMAAGVHLLERHGHPRAAKVVSVISTLTGLGPAVHNLRVYRRRRGL